MTDPTAAESATTDPAAAESATTPRRSSSGAPAATATSRRSSSGAQRRVSRSPRTLAGALALDVVLVIAFAAIGRASHDSHVLIGLGQTAWPFLAALALGWLACLAWRAPTAPVRTGLPVWGVTVVGGMLLRAASGQGTAVPFIIVATLTLLLMLVGWRVVATLITRARTR